MAEAWRIESDDAYRDFHAERRLQGAYVMVRSRVMHLHPELADVARLVNAQEIQLLYDGKYADIAVEMALSFSRSDAYWNGGVAVTLAGRNLDEIARCQMRLLDAGYTRFLIGEFAGIFMHDPAFPWVRDGRVQYHVADDAIMNPRELCALSRLGVVRGADTSHLLDAAIRGVYIDAVSGWARGGRIPVDGFDHLRSDSILLADHNVLCGLRWAAGWGDVGWV